MSCRLFHGPGGRSSAIADAHQQGNLIREPIGDEGLKVDGAREIVSFLQMPPPNSQKGALVLGPLDLAQPAAADALLKTIEDLDETRFILNLWAFDVAEVLPTIQSRCEHVWCPERLEHDYQPGEDVYDVALSLVESYRNRDPVTLLEILKDQKNPSEVLRTVPDVLAVDLLAGRMRSSDRYLWVSLRKVLEATNLSKTEVAAVLMPKETS